MSLINEALKRAEREKRRRRSESEHPDIPPVPEPQRRSSAPSILSASVVIVLVIAIGAGVVFFLSRSTTPSAAVASIAPIAPPITPQVQPTAKPAKLVIIKTQEALDYYEPAKQHRSGTDLLTKRLLASAANGIGGYLKTAQTRLNHQARLLPSRTSPGGSSGRSDQAHATTQRATIADIEVAQRTGANLDPATFTVSGIIHGPSGPRAIINGCMVRVGQRITNATVVQINVHTVELQRGSQRITISM